jgi:Cu+-exporting ATPase
MYGNVGNSPTIHKNSEKQETFPIFVPFPSCLKNLISAPAAFMPQKNATEVPPESSPPCYHCGESCGRNPVLFDEKKFCCNGCKTVYEILSRSNACDYYSFETHPGRQAVNLGWGNRYAYLDNEEIRNEIMEFSEDGIGKVKLFIPVIHCSSCIWLLENLHRLNPAVIHSMVNFVKKEVTITFREREISLRQLVELLVSVNYVPQISAESVSGKTRRPGQHAIYYRLGVAGFCFGNIMLFSFPAYLSVDNAVEAFLRQNFGLMNILLGIPVAFYSGYDYLVSAYKGLKKKIISIDVPIAIGILVLFFRSFYEIVTGSGPGFMDSLAGLVFFLLIGRWYQGKTYEALSFERDYQSYFPVAVTLVTDEGTEQIIPLKKLRTGMRILVRNQELVPADALLVSGEGYIDYSFVTGESTPHEKKEGERIFAGGRQVGPSIELVIEREVSQSRLTELWNQDPNNPGRDNRWEPFIDILGRRFTAGVLLVATAAGIFWWIADPSKIVNVITSILIVACPCALALTLPFAFGGAMRTFGRNGLFLKRTGVVESLSKVDTIVFDKTGTLTRNDIFDVDLSSVTDPSVSPQWIRSLVRHSTHPMSVAIYRSVPGDEPMEVTGFREFPAHGLEGTVGGHLLKVGSASFTGQATDAKDAASGRVYVSCDGISAGFIQIRNRYRPGLAEVLNSLGGRYEMHLLSGDNDAEMEELLKFFPGREHLNFFQTPADKLAYIRKLKQQGKRVLMIGDGLNDAGALRESDCGISIADDVYHFSPACDAILESDKFRYLSVFLRFSRLSVSIVYLSLLFSLAYNLAGITIAILDRLTPVVAAILMPLSSVTVVSFIALSISIIAWYLGLWKKN